MDIPATKTTQRFYGVTDVWQVSTLCRSQKKGFVAVRFVRISYVLASPSIVILTSTFNHLPKEDYLADKNAAGKRKAASESDEESEEDMATAATPKSTKKAAKPTPAKTPTKTPTEEDVENLADEVEKKLKVNSWYKVDRTQAFAILACVVPDIGGLRYVYIRIELVGSVNEHMIESSITEDGTRVIVKLKQRKGGELVKSSHSQRRYGLEDGHPLLVALRQVERAYGEVHEEVEETVTINMPFRVDTRGFYDPIDETDVLDLGIFPLPRTEHNPVPNAPKPSTKLLHLWCEEHDKPKMKQDVKSTSYFDSPSPPPSPPDSTMGH